MADTPYYPPPPERQGAAPQHWGAAPVGPPPPPKKKRSGLWLALASLALGAALVLCFIGASALFGNDDGTLSPARTVDPTTAQPAKGNPPATKAKAAPATIGDGEWLVGDDVKAGTYRTKGAEPGMASFCHWTVWASDDPDAHVVTLGSSSEEDEPGRVVLKRGQKFNTSDCKDWVRQ